MTKIMQLDHFAPYILSAYGITLVALLMFALVQWRRFKHTQRNGKE